ncbi:MAG: alpha/beta hydrolase, partial [Actinomycetota bacterium]|nr:alpha/beta hydrolase [Actinomycetota bacterium]
AYIDPVLLFSDAAPNVFLVPDEELRPATVTRERAGLLDSLRGLADQTVAIPAGAVQWARDTVSKEAAERFDELRGAAHLAWQLQPSTHIARIGKAGFDWWKQRQDCTAASTPPPPRTERHVAVLVGGLGSSSTNAAVDRVDTGALGYAPDDVMRFSYNGGTTKERPYDAAATTADIRQSARRLRELLERVAAQNPGVPIDILAHSQGGLVSRAALGDEIDLGAPALQSINSLVTLGTPHQGAELATAAKMVAKSAGGQLLIDGLSAAGAPVKGTSVEQLAETSQFLRRLNERPLPPGVHVTSIGGRGDLVVPAGRTHLAGAENVIVPVAGVFDEHSQLPGSGAARREIALGQAGLPPTCQSLPDMFLDTVTSDTIGWAEDMATTDLWLGTRPFTVPPGLDRPAQEGNIP